MFSLYVINECKRFLRPCAPSVFRRKTMHLTNWTAMENSTSISLEIVFRRVEQHILHHFVSRCLHSLSSTITRFPKKKKYLLLLPVFSWFFFIIFQHQSCFLLRISVNDIYCTTEPRYRSYKTEKRSVEDDYSRQKYPSKADSVDFSGKTKTLLARHTFTIFGNIPLLDR